MSGRQGTALAVEFKDVTFSYPAGASESAPQEVLSHVSLGVPEGAFSLLVGDTGSGKTTLLRLAKRELAPAGEASGEVLVCGSPVANLDREASAGLVGFVFQDPDSQIVCDTVWHELAFGLENLRVSQQDMRRRVAETCYFLGIEPWYRMATADLSGGQRQILALASVLVMRPRVLLLDEPTSMLDPISARSFVEVLARLNRELGITVLVATHTPQVFLSHANQVLQISDGKVQEVCEVQELGEAAIERVPGLGEMSASGGADGASGVRDLGEIPAKSVPGEGKALLSASNLWLRYGKDDAWVLNGCDFDVAEGEVRAIVGSNGCGKSTLISVLAGSSRPQRGKVRNAASSSQMILPQNPKALVSCETVAAELMEWSSAAGYGEAEMCEMAARLGLDGALDRHPLDLSGGQLQLLGMAKLALTRPRLMLLDEPTKGVDAKTRRELARLVLELAHGGTTVVLSTHDLAFASKVANSVSVLFDGQLILTEPADEFFEKSELYRLGAG